MNAHAALVIIVVATISCGSDSNTDPVDGKNNETYEGYEPECGNRIVDKSTQEECDDGNDIDGDGCRKDCTVENCGDGIKDPQEECDDGNDIDDDQCRRCLLPTCGDGFVDSNEICDDGNTEDNDYCSSDCIYATGECGDGIVQQNEECEPQLQEDGCKQDCTSEENWQCEAGVGDCRRTSPSGFDPDKAVRDLTPDESLYLCRTWDDLMAEKYPTSLWCQLRGVYVDWEQRGCASDPDADENYDMGINENCIMTVWEFDECFRRIYSDFCNVTVAELARCMRISCASLEQSEVCESDAQCKTERCCPQPGEPIMRCETSCQYGEGEETCSNDQWCESGRCLGGECAPRLGFRAGHVCEQDDWCESQNCLGGTCTSSDGTLPPESNCESNDWCSNGLCCGLDTGERKCAFERDGSGDYRCRRFVGDLCFWDSDCEDIPGAHCTGGNGWCMISCSDSEDCGSNSNGIPNVCHDNGATVNCFPGCDSTEYCQSTFGDSTLFCLTYDSGKICAR